MPGVAQGSLSATSHRPAKAVYRFRHHQPSLFLCAACLDGAPGRIICIDSVIGVRISEKSIA